MNKIRFDEVDVLRAFGIIAVIIIHVLTYNLSGPTNKFLWNNLQFFIISFVFCSGYVLSAAYKRSFPDILSTLFWYKKRFIRLVFPFWIYLILHYSLWLLFPNVFSGLGLQKSVDYFVKSATFLGGTNYNWLPLLFIELTILFPFFLNWVNKKKVMIAYLLGATFITVLFTLLRFPYSYYRFVMWVPWSLVLILAIYTHLKSSADTSTIATNKRYLIIGLLFFVVFMSMHLFARGSSFSSIFYDHKYPPDFYYLSFGISMTFFALIIAKLRFWQNKTIKDIYGYLSRNSYQIFFIHYIILDSVLVMRSKIPLLNNPISQFIVIFSLTILISILINKTLPRLPRIEFGKAK